MNPMISMCKGCSKMKRIRRKPLRYCLITSILLRYTTSTYNVQVRNILRLIGIECGGMLSASIQPLQPLRRRSTSCQEPKWNWISLVPPGMIRPLGSGVRSKGVNSLRWSLECASHTFRKDMDKTRNAATIFKNSSTSTSGLILTILRCLYKDMPSASQSIWTNFYSTICTHSRWFLRKQKKVGNITLWILENKCSCHLSTQNTAYHFLKWTSVLSCAWWLL